MTGFCGVLRAGVRGRRRVSALWVGRRPAAQWVGQQDAHLPDAAHAVEPQAGHVEAVNDPEVVLDVDLVRSFCQPVARSGAGRQRLRSPSAGGPAEAASAGTHGSSSSPASVWRSRPGQSSVREDPECRRERTFSCRAW